MDNVIEMNQGENIKIKNQQLNDYNFSRAWGTLKAYQFRPRVSYTISYIDKKIQSLTREAGEELQKLAKKYGELDDSGNLKPELNEKGMPVPGTFKLKEDVDREEFIKEQGEFMDIEHELNKRKLDVNSLEDVKLSANDISALEPMLCGLED